MRAQVALFFMLLTSLASLSPRAYAEDWKGQPENTIGSFGAITGLGIFNGTAGYSLLGTVSKVIVPKGFVGDLNNSVSVEVEAGPLFVSSSTAFQYGAHLRWDFTKDDYWTLYGLGGLGGYITGNSLGDRFELFPRFGVGALYRVALQFAIRAEIADQLIAVGVMVPF